MAATKPNTTEPSTLDINKVLDAVESMELPKDHVAELLLKLPPLILQKLREGHTRKAILETLAAQGIKASSDLSKIFAAARKTWKTEKAQQSGAKEKVAV